MLLETVLALGQAHSVGGRATSDLWSQIATPELHNGVHKGIECWS